MNVVSDALYQQIVDAVRFVRSVRTQFNQLSSKIDRQTTQRARRFRVILDEDVAASVNPLGSPEGSLDPTKPNATRCQWNGVQGKYEQTAERLHVANHSEEDFAADDAAWAEPQDGHYVLSGCPTPVPNRPTPPWMMALILGAMTMIGGCCCGKTCARLWNPRGDYTDQLVTIKDASITINNDPLSDAMGGAKVYLDGPPTGAIPMQGGPLHFGPSPNGIPGELGGVGYYNVNPHAVRMHRFLEFGQSGWRNINLIGPQGTYQTRPSPGDGTLGVRVFFDPERGLVPPGCNSFQRLATQTVENHREELNIDPQRITFDNVYRVSILLNRTHRIIGRAPAYFNHSGAQPIPEHFIGMASIICFYNDQLGTAPFPILDVPYDVWDWDNTFWNPHHLQAGFTYDMAVGRDTYPGGGWGGTENNMQTRLNPFRCGRHLTTAGLIEAATLRERFTVGTPVAFSNGSVAASYSFQQGWQFAYADQGQVLDRARDFSEFAPNGSVTYSPETINPAIGTQRNAVSFNNAGFAHLLVDFSQNDLGIPVTNNDPTKGMFYFFGWYLEQTAIPGTNLSTTLAQDHHPPSGTVQPSSGYIARSNPSNGGSAAIFGPPAYLGSYDETIGMVPSRGSFGQPIPVGQVESRHDNLVAGTLTMVPGESFQGEGQSSFWRSDADLELPLSKDGDDTSPESLVIPSVTGSGVGALQFVDCPDHEWNVLVDEQPALGTNTRTATLDYTLIGSPSACRELFSSSIEGTLAIVGFINSFTGRIQFRLDANIHNALGERASVSFDGPATLNGIPLTLFSLQYEIANLDIQSFTVSGFNANQNEAPYFISAGDFVTVDGVEMVVTGLKSGDVQRIPLDPVSEVVA